MAMPKYRLQTLLEMRERAEEEAKNALAREQARLAEEERKLQELEDEKQQMIQARIARRNELSQKMREGGLSVQKIQQEYSFLDRMAREIAAMDDKIYRQEQAVSAQQMEVQRAQDLLVEKSKELKALEKHKEKWSEETKKELRRKEEERADEIGQQIFMFNRNR